MLTHTLSLSISLSQALSLSLSFCLSLSLSLSFPLFVSLCVSSNYWWTFALWETMKMCVLSTSLSFVVSIQESSSSDRQNVHELFDQLSQALHCSHLYKWNHLLLIARSLAAIPTTQQGRSLWQAQAAYCSTCTGLSKLIILVHRALLLCLRQWGISVHPRQKVDLVVLGTGIRVTRNSRNNGDAQLEREVLDSSLSDLFDVALVRVAVA